MSKIITIPNGWKPRSYQKEAWSYLENGGKRLVAICHRRWGKDDIALHFAATQAIQKPANYWHMLPEAAQARKAIWDAVNPHTGKRRIDEAFPLEIRATTRENEMAIGLINGSTWQVVGSDNYNSLLGSPPAGIVYSEWAVAKSEAWTYLSPILEENGGYAIFITTPRGDNHAKRFYEMALRTPGWCGILSGADKTDVYTPAQLEKIRSELVSLWGETRGVAKFNQEYYCSFYEAFDGKAVYPDYSERMHKATESLLPYAKIGASEGRTIYRGWDNTGLFPACILFYINTSGCIYVFKEFIGEDIAIDVFGETVNIWCAENLSGASFRDIGDPAGRTRDSIKKSARDYLSERCGIFVEDGIQTFKIRVASVSGLLSRLKNGMPMVQIDPECKILIEGFAGGYQYPEIGNTGVYKPEPAKNIHSHIHDAFQYPCTVLFANQYTNEDLDIQQDYDFRTGRNAHGGY